MISAILPYRREGRNLSREDSRLNPTSQFRATSPLTAQAKTGAIFVKKTNYRWAIRYRPAEPRQALVTKIQFWSRNQSRGCQINQIPLEPCCNLLTKNIFSSRTAPRPSQTLPYPVAGQQADCRGRAFNFRQEIFQRATVFQIRCSSQRVSPILIYRTEQFR